LEGVAHGAHGDYRRRAGDGAGEYLKIDGFRVASDGTDGARQPTENGAELLAKSADL
jgi:hypothetical protein